MKHLFWLIFFFLGTSFVLSAQDDTPNENLKNLQSLKIGLITKRLNLNPEQAKGFWVLYEEFNKEREELRKEKLKMTLKPENRTDEELRKDLDGMLALKEKEIGIERKYINKFLSVITIQQVVSLYKAEAHFKRILLESLKKCQHKEGEKHKKWLE